MRDLTRDNVIDDTSTDTSTKNVVRDTVSIQQQEKLKKENPRIDRVESFIEVFTDSSSIKAIKPRKFYDQIKLEDDGSNGKLWVYVTGLTTTPSNNWKKVTLS